MGDLFPSRARAAFPASVLLRADDDDQRIGRGVPHARIAGALEAAFSAARGTTRSEMPLVCSASRLPSGTRTG